MTFPNIWGIILCLKDKKKRETLASVLPPGSGKKIDRTTAFGVELNQSMSFKIGSLTPPARGVAPMTIGWLRIGFSYEYLVQFKH